MPNGTWKRSTAASRRAERQVRYAHTSVLVGVNQDPVTGMLTATRTPKGEGSTARRTTPKVRPRKAHDWLGAYPGRLASLEVQAKMRRKVNQLKRRPLVELLAEAMSI